MTISRPKSIYTIWIIFITRTCWFIIYKIIISIIPSITMSTFNIIWNSIPISIYCTIIINYCFCNNISCFNILAKIATTFFFYKTIPSFKDTLSLYFHYMLYKNNNQMKTEKNTDIKSIF